MWLVGTSSVHGTQESYQWQHIQLYLPFAATFQVVAGAWYLHFCPYACTHCLQFLFSQEHGEIWRSAFVICGQYDTCLFVDSLRWECSIIHPEWLAFHQCVSKTSQKIQKHHVISRTTCANQWFQLPNCIWHRYGCSVDHRKQQHAWDLTVGTWM